MMALIGELPEDGSPIERQHVLRFADGEAAFNFDGIFRTLSAVQLDFTAHVESITQVHGDAYRYVSAAGVIEVADRKLSLGDGEIFMTEHRRSSETPSK